MKQVCDYCGHEKRTKNLKTWYRFKTAGKEYRICPQCLKDIKGMLKRVV